MQTTVGDYTPFQTHWTTPHGGIRGYLTRFLASGDATFQHIAIWTLLQLLESEDAELISLIRESGDIVKMVQQIEERGVEMSDDGYEEEESGEQEVVGLARRSLELLDAHGGGRGGSAGDDGESVSERTLVDG